jgi:hypothetical protein
MVRLNLTKLSEVKAKEKYRFQVLNRSAALEDLDTEMQIASTWEAIREDIRISANENLGYYELKSISHDSIKDAQNY